MSLTLSRSLLVLSAIIFIVCIFFLTLEERERFGGGAGAGVLLYYRITDALNYKAASLDAPIPFSEYGELISKTNVYDKAQVVMFETLNRVDLLMTKMVFPAGIKYVYGVAGSDSIASKSLLAITLRTCLDAAVLDTIIPKTYVMENGIDQERWLTDTRGGSGNAIFIMKKNVQRQEGFLITSDRQKIMDGFNPVNDWVVCQELLQNPLLVGGRKVNLRIYLLVVVGAVGGVRGCSMYAYNDGFMYYTPAPFKAGTVSTEENITTGYIDRQVYVDNPLTVQDLLLQLAPAASNILWANVLKLMGQIAGCYAPLFVDANKSIPGTKFLIYGCDIAPSNDYNCKLMEVNKGPDLSYKDDRDGLLKREMVRQALSIVGIGADGQGGPNFLKLI
jgi:hypothetical protein